MSTVVQPITLHREGGPLHINGAVLVTSQYEMTVPPGTVVVVAEQPVPKQPTSPALFVGVGVASTEIDRDRKQEGP